MHISHRDDDRTSRTAGSPGGHRAKSRTRRIMIGGGALAAATAVTVAVTVASASQYSESAVGADHAVFVQGNELDGNTIHVFARGDDGKLSPSGTYQTGGEGGDQVDAPTDSLAFQGSLVYAEASGRLLAVNAGSGTVTSFRVEGQQLTDRRVVDSGGEFPASIAVHGRIAYVMNAGGGGSVQGFRITGKGLKPLQGSHRSLGLDNEDIPLFSSSPGEVEFTPDGRNLVVTTKSDNTVEVFPMKRNGLPAVAEPVVTRGRLRILPRVQPLFALPPRSLRHPAVSPAPASGCVGSSTAACAARREHTTGRAGPARTASPTARWTPTYSCPHPRGHGAAPARGLVRDDLVRHAQSSPLIW